MRRKEDICMQERTVYRVRKTHFPVHIFFIIFLSLLAMGGIHAGLVLGLVTLDIRAGITAGIVIAYWAGMSVLLALYTREQMKRSYEKPVQELAKAAEAVAKGDFSVYVSPMHTPEKLDYLDVMIMDFNKMVEQLGSIETLKTDFFSNVSHEIKTPIAVILNAAQMLSEVEMTREEQLVYIETITQSSRKLSALITNILKLNKLEKQKIQPVMEEYDLCSQLCDCALQFENTWEEKEIEFEVEIEEERSIRADESLLELVWTNLLSNAMKFTEAGGRVSLREWSEGDDIVVEVLDTGCGMSEQTRQHIFDKFYQGDTSHETEGNGLGLALALRIIRMMDGSIEVDSAIGKGSSFRVRLPKNRI